MNLPIEKVEYALVYPDGSAVLRNHQDDHETPIVADSLNGLFREIEDFSDMSVDDLDVDERDGVVGGITLDEQLFIVRREVRVLALTGDDLQQLASLRQVR